MGCGSSKTAVYDDASLKRPKPKHSRSGASIVQCSGCGNLYSSVMSAAFCDDCTSKLERAARQQSRVGAGELDSLQSSTSLTRPMDYGSDNDETQLDDSDGLEITELDDDNILSVPVAHKTGQESTIRLMYTIPEVSEENSREVTPAPSKYSQLMQNLISVTVEDQETGFKEEIFKLNADYQLIGQINDSVAHSKTDEKPMFRKVSEKETNGPDKEEATINGQKRQPFQNNDHNKLQLETENKLAGVAEKITDDARIESKERRVYNCQKLL